MAKRYFGLLPTKKMTGIEKARRRVKDIGEE